MLTISQTERLVRRIGELLGQPALEAQAAKLAQDYAELGRAAGRRLEQCALMIDAGEELQALQLAETPPPLLDLITVLSFRQAGEWREYCQKHGLPFVEPFYDKFVRQLNATYGKGIASDHPYYRDYRRAVLTNEEERALSILRVIARLNPADQNVAQELHRLEDKTLRARLERLRQTIDSGSTEEVLAQLAELEGSALPIPPTNPVWQKAQLLRCRQMLDQAETLRQREAWAEAESVVEEIRTLANQNRVPLTPEDTARWNALEEWTHAQRTAQAREQDLRRATEALEYFIQTGEQQRAHARGQPLAQLQSELNSLNAKWQDAERFGALDAGLAGRCQEQSQWLRSKMQRAAGRKRLLEILCAGVAIAAVASAAFFFWDFTRQRQLAVQLHQFETQRRVGDTQKLLAGLSPRLQRRLAQAVPEAEHFVAAELALKKAFEQKLAAVRAAAAQPESALAQVERQRSECLAALGQLAPEFQPPGKTDFDAFDQQWQSQLGTMAAGHNTQFSTRLAEAERLAAGRLNATNGPEALRAALPGIQSVLADLEHLHGQPVPLQEDLGRRFVQLTNQVGTCVRTLAEWDGLWSARPHSLEEHLERLKQLERSPLASPSQRAAIEEIDRLRLTRTMLLGQLLLPGQPEVWDSLTNLPATAPAFRPETPSDAEKEAYLKLRDDPNMHDVYAYWLTTNASRNDNPYRSHAVFTRGALATNKLFQPTGLIYDWQKSPDKLRFEQQAINSYDYASVEKKGLTQESDAFERLGLRDLIDPNSGNYQKSMLELLDRLNQDGESSALFRAYVTLRLFEIAQQRPNEWGLLWAPSTRKERKDLEDLRMQNLQSGDWMVPNQTTAYKEGLQHFYKAMRQVAFEKEAGFFYRLTQQAVEKGFEFAGYLDGQNVPVLEQTNAPSGEYWGWSSQTRTAALLLKRNGDAWQTIAAPLPFTPLFAFQGDRRLLLDQTAKLTGYSPDANPAYLPPLFGGLVPLAAGPRTP
jgi:hypothetical protein